DSTVWSGTTYKTTGVYNDTLQSSLGCDSVVTLTLTINNAATGDTTATACDSLVWYGNTYNATGTYRDTLQTSTGCDSIITLDLTIVSPVTNNVDSTICFGDSALLAGVYQTVSGSYNDTIVGGASNTCDSIVVTALTVRPKNVGDTTVLTACDSTVWGGTTYTATGVYNDTLPSAVGCDSIITLDLTIVSPVTNNVDSTICFGDSALLAGVYQMVSGSYNDTIVGGAVNTCDSIVVTALTVLPKNVGDTTILVACDSAEWRGTKYFVSGMYNDTLPSAVGCDSIITLDLTINGSGASDTTVLTACDSTVWNGVTYRYNSNYSVNTVGNTFSPKDIIILPGDTVTFINSDLGFHNVNGTTSTYPNNPESFGNSVSSSLWTYQHVFTVEGVYDYQCDPHVGMGMVGTITVRKSINQQFITDTLQSVVGCDSIIILDLTINSSYSGDTTTLVACDSAVWNTITYDSSGVYVDTLQSLTGCDSIVTLDLTINSSYLDDTISLIACDSADWNGTTYYVSGVYRDTIQSVAGCDSIVTIDLTIKDVNIGDTTSLVVCDEFITQLGDTISTTGIYYDTLQSSFGCDSIITYDITVKNSIIVNVIDTACGVYTSPLGNIYTSTGIYTDTLVSLLTGCDSLIITDLTIYCDDIDGDGIPDVDDDDNDNDGISDDDEGTGDSDGDGIPDYLDIDSDNDGIYDVVESGNGSQDTNNDGVVDVNDNGFTDTDNNGMADGSDDTTPIDSDGDGIANYLDLDSDNDGIYDVIESGNGSQDTNNDGVVDINDTNFTDNDNDGMADGTESNIPSDSDNDGIADFIDLDSDNDGIFDVVESGFGANDTNNDGSVDSNDNGFSDVDNDGMSDNSEGNNPIDTDNDGNPDFMDLDSDGDGCNDVVEAGFTDEDGDGYLGDSPTSEDSLGLVISGLDGYQIPNDNDITGIYDYLEEGSEAIFDIEQPSILEIFDEGGSITISAEASSLSTIFYQWEMSSDDGFSWEILNNDSIFSGVQTKTLLMTNLVRFYDNYLFRLKASTPGFACGSDVYSQDSRIQLEQLFVPEGFSPDGNGINDTWHISGIERYPFNRVEIYNRWEVKVFEIDSYGNDNEWDGTPNVLTNIILGDGQVPEGTYYYIIDLGKGDRSVIKGYVYLRRK
ncbi:MAG: gliding motility-associated C-terminal domain-containing protein, partial [Flavobacteriales bacterium]|nr:gliding motility-associated C-terminal domain-containing protein [Flavobacteriales bacterium]